MIARKVRFSELNLCYSVGKIGLSFGKIWNFENFWWKIVIEELKKLIYDDFLTFWANFSQFSERIFDFPFLWIKREIKIGIWAWEFWDFLNFREFWKKIWWFLPQNVKFSNFREKFLRNWSGKSKNLPKFSDFYQNWPKFSDFYENRRKIDQNRRKIDQNRRKIYQNLRIFWWIEEKLPKICKIWLIFGWKFAKNSQILRIF